MNLRRIMLIGLLVLFVLVAAITLALGRRTGKPA